MLCKYANFALSREFVGVWSWVVHVSGWTCMTDTDNYYIGVCTECNAAVTTACSHSTAQRLTSSVNTSPFLMSSALCIIPAGLGHSMGLAPGNTQGENRYTEHAFIVQRSADGMHRAPCKKHAGV